MNAPAQAGLPALPLKDPKLFRTQCYIDRDWTGNGDHCLHFPKGASGHYQQQSRACGPALR